MPSLLDPGQYYPFPIPLSQLPYYPLHYPFPNTVSSLPHYPYRAKFVIYPFPFHLPITHYTTLFQRPFPNYPMTHCTVYFTLYTVNSTLFPMTLPFPNYPITHFTVYFTMYTVHSISFSRFPILPFTLYTLHCALYTAYPIITHYKGYTLRNCCTRI